MFYCVALCVCEVLLLFVQPCHGQGIVLNLNNTAVLAGNDVTLQCTVRNAHKSFRWLVDQGGIKENFKVMELCSVKYDHVESTGTMALFCNVTKSTYAGRYFCIHDDTLQRSSAELIVIDAEPRCSAFYPVQSHDIMFTCRLVYSGGWAPAAKWQQLTEKGESVGDPVTIMVMSNKFTHSSEISFELPVNVTTLMIGAKYRCTIYFDSSQRPNSVSAINVPSYEYVWTSEPVRTLSFTVMPTPPRQSPETSDSNHAALSFRKPDLVVSNSADHTGSTKQDVDSFENSEITGDVDRLRQDSGSDGQGVHQLPAGHNDDDYQQLQPPVLEAAAGDIDGGLYTKLTVRVVDVNHSRPNSTAGTMAVYATIDHTARANNLSQATRKWT